MSDTLVYLMRHTEPLLPDGRRRFVGRSDPPLSAQGVRHAHLVAEQLRDVRFDSIYSSDLRRCTMTADIIAAGVAAAADVEPVAELREIDAGLWDGLSFEEAAARYPEEYAERERDLVGYRFPGGESFRDLRDRVVPSFLRIVEEGGATILVVAHLGVNRVLLCEFLGRPLEELFSIRQDYGHIDIVRAKTTPGGGLRMQVVTS